MKSSKTFWITLTIILTISIFVLSLFAYSLVTQYMNQVQQFTVVLTGPTEERIWELYKSSGGSKKFWVVRANVVKDDLIEVTLGIRRRDGEDRLREYLNSLGLDYYIVGINPDH